MVAGHGHGLDAGKRRDAAQQRVIEGADLRPSREIRQAARVPVLRQLVLHLQDAIGTETRRDPAQFQKAPHQQAGAGHEDHGECHLRHGQGGKDTAACATCGPGASAFSLESGVDVQLPRLERRHERRADRDNRADRRGGEKGGQVERDGGRSRQRGRRKRDERAQCPPGEPDAKGDRDRAEDQALGEKLPEEPPSSSAQCGSHGDLAGAGAGLDEKKAGGVHARDQQDEGHGTHQRLQGRADRAEHDIVQRLDEDASPIVGRRVQCVRGRLRCASTRRPPPRPGRQGQAPHDQDRMVVARRRARVGSQR